MNKTNTKVIHLVTVSKSVNLMKGQLSFLNKNGYDITVISSDGQDIREISNEENVKSKIIDMKRNIAPFSDLISLVKLVKYFLIEKPDIVNAGTPKAGLLGTVAAKLTGVPVRVYTIRGLRFETSTGLKRKLLMQIEKIACSYATKIVCISPSLRKEVLNNRLTEKEKTVVLGAGSSNGVNLERFKINEIIKSETNEIKKFFNIHRFSFVIGFVGRINKDKGIEDLVNAFKFLQSKHKDIALMIIGNKEYDQKISDEVEKELYSNSSIIEVGPTNNPIPYYYLMDVLAFPTYREGFGNVSVEAQAAGIPVVTTNATGAIDTVIDEVTGLVVEVGDVRSLALAIEKFIERPNLIVEMGKRASERVEKDFNSHDIWRELLKLYEKQKPLVK